MRSFHADDWTEEDIKSILTLKQRINGMNRGMIDNIPNGIILHTSIILDYFQSRYKTGHIIEQLLLSSTCYLVVEQIAELYSGKRSEISPEKDMIETILNAWAIYIPTIDFMKRVGKTRCMYQLSFIDACIEQYALDHSYSVATKDTTTLNRILTIQIVAPKRKE